MQSNFQPPVVDTNGIVAIPGGQETFGVAVEPTALRGAADQQSGQPLVYNFAFTNANPDALGVEVVNQTAENKTTIPLDLDPYDLDPSDPLNQYVQENSAYYPDQDWLQSHNAGSIAFAQDARGNWYALVAGRADEGDVPLTGGGNERR